MSASHDPAVEPDVARDAVYHHAPESLRERVRGAVGSAARTQRAARLRRGLAFGLAFAAVAVASWNLALFEARPRAEQALVREVLNAHVRSTMVEGHLDDVASSDQHTVKPWFTGKLDFAPPVRDFAAEGFPLTGGRLDYLDGQPVAALTYRHRLHTVNLFVWPAPGARDSAPADVPLRGYAIVHWTHDGMRYWAVSDAAAADLHRLAQATIE